LAEGSATHNNHAGLIWAIADLLCGDYKQSEYGRVILPLVLLRRLDCVLEPTKAQVLARAKLLYLVLSKVTEVDLHPDKSATSRWATSART
jgi:type I restriction-modification system DNA methylase subunit